MKTRPAYLLSSFILLLFFSSSCNQTIPSDTQGKIENTLKSVSLFQDSLGINSSILLADFEKVNAAIDSIGYPDAGYVIWEVASTDSLNFRFMVEGYWPDQSTYKEIHNHDLYKKATELDNASWSSLKSTWYYKFKKVK